MNKVFMSNKCFACLKEINEGDSVASANFNRYF